MKKILSTSALFLASVLWGLAFAAQAGASSVPPFTLGAARSIIGALFLIIIIPIFDKARGSERRLVSRRGIGLNRYELIGGAVLGVILAVASFFQQLGINSGTDGGKAAFITALYVVLVPVYALALHKRAPLNVWLAVAISTVGFYFLCIKNDLSIAPSDALVLVCSLIFPIHILVIDRISPRCDGVRMSMVQFLTAFLFNALMALIFEGPVSVGISAVSEAILPVLYLGIASSGIAYTLQIIGQRGSDPTAASIILSLESVFGVIGTALILGTSMTLREYAGSLVVLFAVILSQLDFSRIAKKNKKA